MNEQKPYSKAIILLLKKTVEKGSPVWDDIINYQLEIQEYLAVIGLDLILKKDEGFAFVKQIVFEDDTTLNLVSRRQLGFEVSIVVIVLRQILEDYDNNPVETQSTDRIITNNEIKDEVRLFLPENYKLEDDPIFRDPILIWENGSVSDDTVEQRIAKYYRYYNL